MENSHFDENIETLDNCVARIRQSAASLGFEEAPILELLRNTLPSKLYFIINQLNM